VVTEATEEAQPIAEPSRRGPVGQPAGRTATHPPRRPAHRRRGPSPRVRRRRTFATALLLTLTTWLVVALTHDGPGADTEAEQPVSAAESGAGATPATPGATSSRASAGTRQPAGDLAGRERLGALAQLGPKTLATVPTAARKVVVVRGDGAEAATTRIELYAVDGGTWRRVAAWPGHVGARGWTTSHREGDLSTPVGTFTLSDAGGRLPDPGTALPYDHSSKFVPSGSSVFGDSLEGSFDYVIAIDYNRRTGVSPRDPVHPQGDELGGGIWLHVDHEGPTHGCVSVPREGMVALLRSLTPQDHPVVVMADAARLAT
jgi:L,D-peptidoglycan transpeptidase YkuD (ErfK/YbiS/YcfS/YnhG family)